MLEVDEAIKEKCSALITKLDSDEDFALRFQDDSLGTVKAEGIPDEALSYLVQELDKHFGEEPEVEGHGWTMQGGKRVWVWRAWEKGW